MWEDFSGKKMFHSQWLYRSAETILGETGDPTELFLCDDCDSNPLGSIMSKCKVSLSVISCQLSSVTYLLYENIKSLELQF